MHGTKNIGNMEQKHDYKATVKEQIQYKCGTKLQYMWNKKYTDHGMKHEYKREQDYREEQILSKRRTEL
jgi:hypothetical protein